MIILKKYRIFIIAAFLGSGSSLSAQDWIADMKKMNKVYSDAGSFSMNISVTLYEKAGSSSPMVSYAGSMAKSADNYYSELMGKTTIITDKISLLVDKDQKMILYKKIRDKKKAAVAETHMQVPMSIDSMIYRNAKAKYLVNTPTEKKIQIINKNSEYSKIEITINPVDNTMKQIVFYIENKTSGEGTTEKIVVDYSNVKINSTIPVSLFSEKKYLVIKGNNASVTQAYKNYQLIDQNTPVK